MKLLFFHGSGIAIIMARGRSIPFIYRNSSVLSSIAESDPELAITGKIFDASFSSKAGVIVSRRAIIRSALPLMVFISPLCAIIL